MIGSRISFYSTLTLGVVAFAVLGLNGGALSRSTGRSLATASFGAEARAWALLAEADELCGGTRGRAEPKSRGSSSTEAFVRLPEAVNGKSANARRALAGEALQIARELAERSSKGKDSASILRTVNRLQGRCAGLGAATGTETRLHRSLDGSGSFDRAELLAPFLERLDRAAIETAERFEATEAAATAPATSSARAPGPTREPSSVAGVAETEPVVVVSETPPRPKNAVPPKIRIGRASSSYRQRLRRWSLVFDREASMLRTSRNRLQFEIDRLSMAEALGACRSFGMALARLDPELAESAPSRGLSLRIERMVERYWRGVAECVSGRPAAAFAYLSEGDREWGTIAQMAARMFEPRPMKRLSDAATAASAADAPE